MTISEQAAFRGFGELMAAAWHGIGPADAVTIKSASEKLSEDVRFQSLVCGLASDMYALAGKSLAPERLALAKMACSMEDHTPALRRAYTSSVLEVLGYEGKDRLALLKEAVSKEAGVGSRVTALLSGMASMGLNVAPEALKLVPLLAAAGGAAGGSLWWLANRHAASDDVKNTALKAKVDYYRALTDEISDEMNRRGLLDPSRKDDDRASRLDEAVKDTTLY